MDSIKNYTGYTEEQLLTLNSTQLVALMKQQATQAEATVAQAQAVANAKAKDTVDLLTAMAATLKGKHYGRIKQEPLAILVDLLLTVQEEERMWRREDAEERHERRS